MTTITTS